MHRSTRFVLSCALVIAAACSKPDPKELTDAAYATLNRGDANAALATFEDALAHIGGSHLHPEFIRASIGRCQALARLGDVRTKAELLDLAKKEPGKVTVQDFSIIASELVPKGQRGDALALLAEAQKLFPTAKAKLDSIAKVIRDAAKSAGDEETLKGLKGLGYTE